MWVPKKLKLDLELKFELRLDFSSKEDYEVWAARLAGAVAEMSFVGWWWWCPHWDGALPAAKKWSRQYFRREETSLLAPRFIGGGGVGGDILPVLAMCKFWFSLAQGMHDIKDVRKYDVMSDKDGGKYVLWLRKLCASTGLLRKFRPYKCHREENYHIFEKEEWSVCQKLFQPNLALSTVNQTIGHNFSVNWWMIIGSVSVLFFCAPALVQNPLCDQLRKVQNLLSSKDHSSKLFEWENTKCGLACMHCSALWQCTMHLQCPSKCRKMQKYEEQSNCRVCTCSRWARASNSCWILWWNSLHVLRSPPPAKPPCSVECSLISSTCHY